MADLGKADKKVSLKVWKLAQKQRASKALPLPDIRLKQVFDALDDRLSAAECHHDSAQTPAVAAGLLSASGKGQVVWLDRTIQ